MSFENIENIKGRFIKNSNLGSTGSYKKCISLMETDRNCLKKNTYRLMLKSNVCQHGLAAKTLKREAGTVFQLVLSRLMKYAFL